MSAFAQQENSAQNRHSVSPARPDHANSQHATVWNPFFTQQSAWGNQALQLLLRSRAIQAKLKINEPGDEYEQEAYRVAEQVMRMPEPQLQAAPT